jgi:nicotinate phosphoribosyltransferase
LRNGFHASGRLVISAANPLLTDLYQLNMVQAYLEHRETKAAVFEFFVRKLPTRRGFLVAAGLEQALQYLETLCFTPEDLDWLDRTDASASHCSTISQSCGSRATFTRCPRGPSSFPTSPSCG